MRKGQGDGGESYQRAITSGLPVCAPVPQTTHEDLMP